MPAVSTMVAAMSVMRPAPLNRTARGVEGRCGGDTLDLLGFLSSIRRFLGCSVCTGKISRIAESRAQEILDLSVHAPEFGRRPSLEGVVHLWIEPKGEAFLVH
jgi:hypothetical protein